MDQFKIRESDIIDLLNIYTNKSKDLLSLLKTNNCGLTGGSCMYLFYKNLKYKNLWNLNDLDLVCSTETSDKIIKLLINEIKFVKTMNSLKLRQIVFKNNKKLDIFLINDKEINYDSFFSIKKFDINICENFLTFNNYTITTKVFNDLINKNVLHREKQSDVNPQINPFSKSITTSRVKKYKDRLSKLTK